MSPIKTRARVWKLPPLLPIVGGKSAWLPGGWSYEVYAANKAVARGVKATQALALTRACRILALIAKADALVGRSFDEGAQ